MKLTIIKWRDIPTQVMIKKSRREVEKIQLDNRFMEAVDSAATIADATDTDAYISDWNNEVIEIPDGDIKEPVAIKAATKSFMKSESLVLHTYSAPKFSRTSTCSDFLTILTRGIESSLQTLTSCFTRAPARPNGSIHHFRLRFLSFLVVLP